jgi:hypothetical protein
MKYWISNNSVGLNFDSIKKFKLIMKTLFLSIFLCLLTFVANAQTHNTDIEDGSSAPATFFNTNITPTRHFTGLSVGNYSNGGHIFLGGINNGRGLIWNAMEDNMGVHKYTDSRSAMHMSYSHWNQKWRIQFSNDATIIKGDPVTWQTALQLQPVNGIPEMRLCGNFFAQEINITAGVGWCDYVFEPSYKLRSISSLETYISQHKHLPDVPSAEEVAENGIEVTEMLQVHMKKIEELTLYIIQLQNRIDALEQKEIQE